MKPAIRSEIIVAYSQCPRKAYLLLYNPEQGHPHEYIDILGQLRNDNQNRYIDCLKRENADTQLYNIDNLRRGHKYLLNALIKTDGLEAECGILTKVKGKSFFGHYCYEPTIFTGTHTINKEQKLELYFAGYCLERLQNARPKYATIVSVDGKSHTLKLGNTEKVIAMLLESIHEWTTASSTKPPPVTLNKHCPLCPFQRVCQDQAEQEDNLSLLNGMTPRAIKNYEKKGIFTVKQLSFLFKRRKRRKKSKSSAPVTHKAELQALAIRENKIYIQQLPKLPQSKIELFLDIEGVPDRQFYYLFGLLVRQASTQKYYAFWASTDQDELYVWQHFLDKINQFSDAPIYHYGSYEPRAIITLTKRYQSDTKPLTDRLININSHIYGKIYFPVRSNRLKDIGKFIGAQWTSNHASGLQSLVWRHHWDKSHDKSYQKLLLVYNEEDCKALQLLKTKLESISETAESSNDIELADKPKKQSTETGAQIHQELELLLKYAHFDYDKKKITALSDFPWLSTTSCVLHSGQNPLTLQVEPDTLK